MDSLALWELIYAKVINLQKEDIKVRSANRQGELIPSSCPGFVAAGV